ncbi:DHH family phosphoesterase [Secundilactobacillus hailunensis]|uniref:Cyclic-di-AMP phosphodiesterase n=1 Tax=Secundilactobacillus hailunensis TaxID=2559923 RepID=A0ABW1TCH1_9LACO|nr:DHH family phosphoesterase [Secundilactobacillus hailunensis]
MNGLFSRANLPEFLRNRRLRGLSLFMIALSIAGIVLAFLFSWILGLLALVAVLTSLVFAFNTMNEISEDMNRYIADLSFRINRGEQEALIDMPVGVMIFGDNDAIEWVNPYLQQYFGDQAVLSKRMNDVDPELEKLIQDHVNDKQPQTVTWNGRQFSFLVQKDFRAVYMIEVTHFTQIEQRYENERIAIGQVFLDNYDEVTQSMTDQEVSNLRNYVTNELSTWAQRFGMYLKRLDDDHYLVFMYAQAMQAVENDKFSILDVIRESTSKQNFPLTLSIGIAYGGAELPKLADQAQSNLDLALGRGGDQVVVRAQDEEARFYGGKTNPMEKRTRVRARMISQALQELMNQSDTIFVQGHQQPDMDSIGACMGIRRIAQMNQKQCYIILDRHDIHSDVQKLLDAIKDYPEINDAIITPEEALTKITKQSLLVMVDHSKPSLSISPELYHQLTNRVMIIDHHRRGEEFPENPMLVYIEPYASSTCELITEMFEYQSQESEPINKIEATAMLTGIFIDTKSFSLRTGSRTFDAASYLRSAGADSVQMQQFMKENVDSYLQRNHLIELVTFVHEDLAIIAGEEDEVYDSVTAAQAADDLLNMSGVDASFVITKRDDGRIGISARSMGEINVQIIMEKMGGGGHLSSGATQIADSTVAEVKAQLVDILNAQTAEEATPAT